MSAIVDAADRVRAIVEEAERTGKAPRGPVRMTRAEFDRLPTYQSSMPTGPRPGFRYKREMWRDPATGLLWRGPYRLAQWRDWASVWHLIEVVLDPADNRYLLHVPTEIEVVE